jgi:hypothetical protein
MRGFNVSVRRVVGSEDEIVVDGRFFDASVTYWQGDPNAEKLGDTLQQIVRTLNVLPGSGSKMIALLLLRSPQTDDQLDARRQSGLLFQRVRFALQCGRFEFRSGRPNRDTNI